MTAYLCVGGPWHGQMYESDGVHDEFVMEATPEVQPTPDIPVVYYQHRPVRHTYHRRAIGPNCIVWLHSSIPVTL
jgi:hypothetical protein